VNQVTTHQVGPLNEQLEVFSECMGHKADHRYTIRGFDGQENPAIFGGESIDQIVLPFQWGPLEDGQPNGISIEVLLAVARDRLEQFQMSDMACEENEEAIGCIKAAMGALDRRHRDRVARGVLGKDKP